MQLVKELLSLLEGKFSVENVDEDGNDVIVKVKSSDGRHFTVRFPEDLSQGEVTGDKFQPNEETAIRGVAEQAIERG